ncbi:MAG TPA: hypothetical protein VFQ35_20275 [Polyangiaceae bacterium]|nr:hypothetical protein [Polyangiaceae bacterium]
MRTNLLGSPLIFVCLALASFGCKRKDAAQCEQAITTVKQALTQENFTGATQWREYAYKQCDDAAQLSELDQSIVRKRGEVDARTHAAEQRRTENRQVLKVFLQWVADNRAAPDRASATPNCDAAAPPEKVKSKERLCSASRTAGQYPLLLNYWEAEPAIARFSVKLPDVTSCEEIGASKVLKTWQVPTTSGTTTPRYRCEFPAGPLAGMNAVLSQAVNADLYVFNPSYIEKDPSVRSMLDGS